LEPSRITLLKRAFRSGSSEFWRARLSGAGGFSRPVLVKRLTPDVAAEPRLIERERAEALLTGRLVHPNILAVLDYCLLDGQAVTVLEDVRAVDLLHLLERATVERRRLAPRLALGIAWSVLNAPVQPPMGLRREVLQEQCVHRTLQADVQFADLPFRDRHQLHAGEACTKDEIMAHLADKVARWWLPDDVIFVEKLPHTATGKLLKTELRKRHGVHFAAAADAVT